ncbi:hypothetical protein [Brevundimonas sp.]|uniref:hypothetical protein n=1 Tax=Brevundimonas sp. TaxID=1871086 RepID=UPI00260B373D|nr:hypothetical protein [Brevundimonas sp.]
MAHQRVRQTVESLRLGPADGNDPGVQCRPIDAEGVRLVGSTPIRGLSVAAT